MDPETTLQPPRPARAQDPANGQFLSNDEIAEREEGQRQRQNVARATHQRKPQTPADQAAAARLDEYTLPDSEWDQDLDAQPGQFDLPAPEARPRPSAATSLGNAGETPVASRQSAGAVANQRPPQSRHPIGIRGWAKDIGLPEAEIESYDTDQLTNVLRRIESERAVNRAPQNQRDDIRTNGTPSPEPSRGQGNPPPPPAPTQPQKPAFRIPEEVRATLGDDFAGALENAIPQFIDAYTADLRDENKKLRDRLDRTEGLVRSREDETVSQRIDTAFNALGQEWEGIVGKGSLSSVSQQAGARRQQIVQTASAMAKQRGGHPLDHLQAAAASIFGDFVQPQRQRQPQRGAPPARPQRRMVRQEPLDLDLEEEPLNGHTREEEWFNGGLGQSTNRGEHSEPHGKQRAIRAVTRQMQETRRPIHDQAGYEEDSIPE